MAQGLESLVRIQRKLRSPGDDAIAVLRRLALPAKGEASTGARVRRLALGGCSRATAVDVDTLGATARDPDSQVRREAMHAAAAAAPQVPADAIHSVLNAGRADDSPIIQYAFGFYFWRKNGISVHKRISVTKFRLAVP